MTVICDVRWESGLLAGRPSVATGRERGSMPWTISLHGAAGPVRGLRSSNKAPVRRSAGRWAARAPQRRAGFRAVRPWERGIAPVVLCSHGRACASSGRTRQSVHGLPEDGTNRMPFGVRRTVDASASWTKGRRRGARLRGRPCAPPRSGSPLASRPRGGYCPRNERAGWNPCEGASSDGGRIALISVFAHTELI